MASIHQGYDHSMHGLYTPAISLSIGALETPHHLDRSRFFFSRQSKFMILYLTSEGGQVDTVGYYEFLGKKFRLASDFGVGKGEKFALKPL